MNIPEREIETIRVGALLHDLGKIGISRPGSPEARTLTPEETALIQQHPVIGKRILENRAGSRSYLGIVSCTMKTGMAPVTAWIEGRGNAAARPHCEGGGCLRRHEPRTVRNAAAGATLEALAVLKAFAARNRFGGSGGVVLLGDHRKQQAAFAGTQSLHSLSQAVHGETKRICSSGARTAGSGAELREQVGGARKGDVMRTGALFLLFATAACGQEAGSGFELRTTLSTASFYSRTLASPPMDLK